MLSVDLKDSVAFEIGQFVPEVQAVFVDRRDDRMLHVWTVVPDFDHQVHFSIYAREKAIIDQFPDMDFDFHVVTSRGHDPRTIIDEPGIELAYLRT